MGRFLFASRRFEAFEKCRPADSRGLKVMLVIPPMHYVTDNTTLADDDGTPDPDYDDLMRRLGDLERRLSHFVFLDAHRDGRNSFNDADFMNFDHLSTVGRDKLTRLVEQARIEGEGLVKRRTAVRKSNTNA